MSGARLCSVHNHSVFSDGKNTLAEMAAAAIKQGVRHFGISDHSHTDMSYDAGFVLPRDMTEYKKELAALKEAYRGELDFLRGLEWDSLSDAAIDGFDYWIGSVHSLKNADGRCWCVDSSPEMQADCLEVMFGGDRRAMCETYYAEVAAMAHKKPDILGHIDLITKFNEKYPCWDEGGSHYRSAALGALETVDPAATLLEINTGAMSRGWRSAPYPALFILKEWRARGGSVIITADAHSAGAITHAYDLAAEAARAAGFKSSALLTSGGLEEAGL